MKSEIYGRENDKDLLLLLGWGNRLDNHNLSWLVDLITGAGYRAHVFELPIVTTDFNREYLEPIMCVIHRDRFNFNSLTSLP